MFYNKLNAYYVEDSQIKVDEGMVKTFPFNKEEKPMVLPVKNTLFVLVGENVSISSKAIELLSANNVFLSFIGKDMESFFCNNQKFILPENYSLFLDKHRNQETALKRERFLSHFQKFLENAWEDSIIGDYFYTDDKEIKQGLKKIKECKEDTVLEVFGECENKYCCNELFKGKKKKEIDEILLLNKKVSECLAHIICWEYPYSFLFSFNRETLLKDITEYIYYSILLPVAYIGIEEKMSKQEILKLCLEVFVKTNCLSGFMEFLKSEE